MSSESGGPLDLEAPTRDLESRRPFIQCDQTNVDMITSVSEPAYESLAELFGALASPTRLRVFCTLLREKELNVGDVARISGVPRSNVSHHFHRLHADRLVERRKAGSIVFYRIGNEFFASLVSRTIDWSTRNPDLLTPMALQIARSLCPGTDGPR